MFCRHEPDCLLGWSATCSISLFSIPHAAVSTGLVPVVPQLVSYRHRVHPAAVSTGLVPVEPQLVSYRPHASRGRACEASRGRTGGRCGTRFGAGSTAVSGGDFSHRARKTTSHRIGSTVCHTNSPMSRDMRQVRRGPLRGKSGRIVWHEPVARSLPSASRAVLRIFSAGFLRDPRAA